MFKSKKVFHAAGVAVSVAAVMLAASAHANLETGKQYRWECADTGVTGGYLSYEDQALEAAQRYADDESTSCDNIFIVEADIATWEETDRYPFYPE